MEKCSDCQFCKKGRTTPINMNCSYSKNVYVCKHNKHPYDNVVGYSDASNEGLATIKTSPRWCPMRNGNLVKGITFK